MQNTLSDLNNHLFAQIELLSDEGLKGENLTEAIERSRAISSLATQIILNGNLAIKAQQFRMDVDGRGKVMLPKFMVDVKEG